MVRLIYPMSSDPGRPEGAALLPLPFPDEPVDLILWLVGDAVPAGPWLPTVAEQDQAWQTVYGDAARQRQVRHLAARAQAGMPV